MYRVLIVDDEDIIRRALSRMIDWKSLSCEVIATARNGKEAFQLCVSSMPDIIITDLVMPEMDGLEFLSKLRELDREVKVIVLSGYGEFKYAQQALRLGASDYLLKPATKEEMSAVVRKLVKDLDDSQRRQQQLLTGGIEYARAMLLELLNNPENTEVILHHYRPKLRKEKDCGALVVSIKEEIAHALSKLKSIQRQFLLDSILPPMGTGDKLYGIFLIEDISRYKDVQNAINADKELSLVFHGAPADAVKRLMRSVSSYRNITIFSEDGRQSSFSNEVGYLRRIAMLNENLKSAEQTGTDFKSMVNCLSMEEAKDVLLRYVLEKESTGNKLLADTAEVLKTANSPEDISNYLARLVTHNLYHVSDDKLSYPVKAMKEYIEEHYSEEGLSLKKIADDVLSMDRAYLSKIFQKELGVKFSDYLNQFRINRAKDLLTMYHNSRVQEIANEVGFGNNPGYFSQVFKKYTGVLPSDYKEK